MKKRPYHLYFKCVLLAAVIVCAFGLCGYRLMKIQLVNSETYISRKYHTYTYDQTIEATRGEIVDSSGEPIVVNKVGYSVVIIPEKFPKNKLEGNRILLTITNMLAECGIAPDMSMPISFDAPYEFTTDDDDTLEHFKSLLGLNVYATPDNCIKKLVQDYQISLEYPENAQRLLCGLRYEMLSRGFAMNRRFVLADDIPLKSISKIKESGIDLPGVEITEMPLRSIKQGDVIPHEIGTVGPIYAEEYEELSEKGYEMDDIVGKSGIEKACESYLRGINGTRTISVQNDEVISAEITEPVQSGNTVMLTVDSTFQKDLQKTLEKFIRNFDSLRNEKTEELHLGKVTNGAVVVLDAKTSGVLGMATCPTYDLNTYIDDYDSLLTAENKPLINRATMGLYRPGSTFKTITATAGLCEHLVSGYSTFYCGHTYLFKDTIYRCTGSHGDIGMIQALQYSCNIYFYKLSENLTIDRISKYASMYGLGQETGLETYEESGHLSDMEYYDSVNLPWTVGEVLQSGIGQSEWAVTPLQMAVVANTIANKGIRYEPHLVDSIWDYSMENKLEQKEPVVAQKITACGDEGYEFIKLGMIAAAGTNMPDKYSLTNLGYDVAIKTGTPEQGSRVQDSFFIGFAPADDPEIAFAGIVEGGEYSKYMIRDILKAYESYKERKNAK